MTSVFQYQHAMANPDESLAPIYQEIYQENVNRQGKIGMVRRLGPRTYVYCKNGAVALGIGMLAVQPTPVANHQNIAVQAAAAIDDEEVTVTLGATAVTSNQYEDGFLMITDATGQGTTYRIRSNPAADASANLILTLYDKLHTALDTTSEVHLIANPYNGPVISVADQLDIPAGVPNIAITASYYFWLQTGGLAAVLHDNDPASQGQPVTISALTVGAVGQRDAVGEPLVGYAAILGVSTEYSPIDLRILV